MKNKRKVEVVPYKQEWQERFESESVKLKKVFGEEVITIHHIGSTAISGMPAKPIIDILLEVKDTEMVDKLNEKMEQIGYKVRGENGIVGRRYFQKEESGIRTYHVHVFQNGSLEIEKHLNFRDYLRSHPKVAQTYGKLKEELAEKYPEDIESYMQGKNNFIQEIDRKAKIWKNLLQFRG